MRIAPATVLFCVLAALRAWAGDVVWPDRGVITIPANAGWIVQAGPASDSACNVKVVPRSGANAQLLITVLQTPSDLPIDPADVPRMLMERVRPHLETAVEKSPSPCELAGSMGRGWFVELTDASLVGKPPVVGQFKVIRSAMLALDAHALAIATVFFDDPGGPELPAMMALLQGTALRRTSGAAALTLVRRNGNLVLTVPSSRVVLVFPEGRLKVDDRRSGGGTENPGYFLMHDAGSGLNISGWFEPAEKYQGDVKAFWAQERRNLIHGSDLALKDESFAKEGEWAVVYYTIPVPGTPDAILNCRAECVKDGTWIDLHLSMPMSKRAPRRLSDFLRAAIVEAKP